MPVFGGQTYRPKGAKGIGGGWWVNQSRGNPRRGRRFRVTWDRQSGYVYHDYGGGRRVRVSKIGGGRRADPNAPRAPSAPRVTGANDPNAPGGSPTTFAPNARDPNMPAGTGGAAGAAKPGAPKPGAPKPGAKPGLADDATAAQERAQLRFDTAQKLAELAQQGAYDRADLAESFRRSEQQRGLDVQSTREGANRAGLFYSGQLGKQQDELASRYARARFDQQQTFDRGEAGRVAARAALQQGATLEEAAISARNADRKVESDTSAADARTLVPEGEPPGAPAKDPLRGLGRFGAVRMRGIGGGQWRVRFKSGALRTLRFRNGRWEIKRSGGWRPFH